MRSCDKVIIMLTKTRFHHSQHHQPVRNAESALTWASAVKYRLSCLSKLHVMLPQKEAKKRKRERAKRTSKKKTRKKKRRKRADEKRRPRGDETRRDETRRKGSGALGRVWGRQGIIPGAGVQLHTLWTRCSSLYKFS